MTASTRFRYPGSGQANLEQTWSEPMIRRGVFGAFFLFALTPQAPLRAAEPFEGIWAKTQAECRDDEGANSRTLIDLENMIDGKPAPMFDQYENHCRIERKFVVGNATNLAVTCFEFWEYFTKGIEGQKAIIKLSPVQKGRLKIDGTAYQRCAAKPTPDRPERR